MPGIYNVIADCLSRIPAHANPSEDLHDIPNNDVIAQIDANTNGKISLAQLEQAILLDESLQKSLDGFALALTPDGRFLYISETVSIYLGLSQVEVTGSSIFDYVHREDHTEISEQLGLQNIGQNVPSPGSVVSDEDVSSTSSSSARINHTDDKPVTPISSIQNDLNKGQISRSFCVRMKSTLTKRGCHFKSAGYRVVLLLCRMRPQYSFNHSRKPPQSILGMVALAIALPPPSINEVRLESDMYVTRLTFEFKIAHCESRVEDLIDYTADELTGQNMYTLCHGQDVHKIKKLHVDLITKGQAMSEYYRIMNRNGGYTWVQTCATVIINNKNADEQSIICVNYILSKTELNTVVMDRSQMEDERNLKPDDPNKDFAESSSSETDHKEDGGNSSEPPCTPEDGESESQTKNDSHNEDQSRQQVQCSFKEISQEKKSVDCSVVTKESRQTSCSLPNSRRKRKYSEEIMEKTDSVIIVPTRDTDIDSRDTSNASSNRHSPKVTSDANILNKDSLIQELVDVEEHNGDNLTETECLNIPEKQSPSSIQWIGSGQSSTLSASALLRHIYANRESVIRSNFHANRPPYYSDVHGSIPTPPSSESYLDQTQFLLQSKLNNSPYSPTISQSENYNSGTPPSSVSPRDKYQCTVPDSPYTEMRQYVSDHGHIQPFSIKPQMYMNPVTTMANLSDTLPYPQQQLAQHEQPSFYNAHHSTSFHLYHTGLNKVPLHASSITYIDGLKNSTPWYSQSSS
ncbi:Protein trachealess [Nymphon striatum]|nr:Protein trachealess [Nymphon striatum]